MMLLLVIPLAWLALVGMVVVLCKAAARGDARQTSAIASAGRRIAPGLVVWDAPLACERPLARRLRRTRGKPTAAV
jgi:hypothetical protein